MQYTYIEGPHPLYISYVSPVQTKQDRHHRTIEAARDKGLGECPSHIYMVHY